MLSGNNYKFYKKKENKFKNLNSKEEKNYKTYNTKADILPYNNVKYKKNSKVFINLDPEYLEKNYKKGEKNYLQNYRDNKKPDNQANNNNYQINENISRKEPTFQRNQNNHYSPKKNNTNNFNYLNNIVDNENRKINPFSDNNDFKNASPIKKYIEKKNFIFYLNKGIKSQKENNNDINNKSINEKKFVNKSFDLNKAPNNRYNQISRNDNFNISQTQTERNKASFNIFQQKMITIFTQIISKIIKNHKKKNILNAFLSNLKRFYFQNKEDKNYSSSKFQKKNSKYNEYKYIINNYVKTNNKLPMRTVNNILKNENELIKKIKKSKESINFINNNQYYLQNKNNNNIQRLKELQKKYGKIYEKKKKSNASFDDKYNYYFLRKIKTQNNLTNKNINNNSEILSDQNKMKLLKNKLLRNVGRQPKMNLSQSIYPKINYSFSPSFFKETIPSISKDNNKIIIKKLKITPKLSKNIKKWPIDNTNEEIFTVYNIKDIVTSDKRLYVYINYIELFNQNNTKNESFYDNNLLKISNEFDINIKGLDKKKNKKNIINSRFKIYPNKLSEIEEEPYDKKNNINPIEKGIFILEKYKNNLKKEISKNSILDYKNEDK